MGRESVRRAAESHVRAIVEGRIDEALDGIVLDLRDESSANLILVAPLVEDGTIGDITLADDTAIVELRFVTPGGDPPEVRIQSEWWEIEGRPQLVRAVQVTERPPSSG